MGFGGLRWEVAGTKKGRRLFVQFFKFVVSSNGLLITFEYVGYFQECLIGMEESLREAHHCRFSEVRRAHWFLVQVYQEPVSSLPPMGANFICCKACGTTDPSHNSTIFN